MLDTIQLAMSGLQGHAEGLKDIANNVANLNTVGFKASVARFASRVDAGAPHDAPSGGGLMTLAASIDPRAGELRSTGLDTDLALDGEGLFVLRDAQDRTRYTRAGQFEFDAQGILVSRADRAGGSAVMALDASGQAVPVSLAGLRTVAGQATRTVSFTGNLASTEPEITLGSVKVFDASGKERALSLKFTAKADAAGSWQVDVREGASTLGRGTLAFVDGKLQAGSGILEVDDSAAQGPGGHLTLDFSQDVTSFASGSLSTLAMGRQDGSGPGTLARTAFDERGVLTLAYSNGRTAEGPRLLLARPPAQDAMREVDGNLWAAADERSWQTGVAGEGGFGAVRGAALEASNVDLTREFSELVILQRGFQGSSQVISTTGDMIQELFQLQRR